MEAAASRACDVLCIPHTTSDCPRGAAAQPRLTLQAHLHLHSYGPVVASRLSRLRCRFQAVCCSQILLIRRVPHEQRDREQLAARPVVLSVKHPCQAAFTVVPLKYSQGTAGGSEVIGVSGSRFRQHGVWRLVPDWEEPAAAGKARSVRRAHDPLWQSDLGRRR